MRKFSKKAVTHLRSFECKRAYVDSGDNAIYIDDNKNLFVEGVGRVDGLFYAATLWNESVWAFDNKTNTTVVVGLKELNLLHRFDYYIKPLPDVSYIDSPNCLAIAENISGQYWCIVNSDNYAADNKWPIEYGINGIKVLLDSSVFLSQKDNVLSCHRLTDGEIIWQVDFNQLLDSGKGNLFDSIKILEGKIYLSLIDYTNQIQCAVICLNITNGAIVHKWNKLSGRLSVIDKKLYVISLQTVHVIDLENFAIDFQNYKEELSRNEIYFKLDKCIVSKDEILYFVNGLSIATNRFGAIDIRSKKLLWINNIEINDGINNNIQDIQVSDTRLFIHTSDNVLHIFERNV
ncbi:hypothetical protein [Tellurirhabdus rosea]|uniref:hypothetical protein n=1 Tax=Tellurirhabdus rosea TaxID=2674997 RepID=UPI0022545F46|nr:hypothetical protein [Tellurirhabdus rosea]